MELLTRLPQGSSRRRLSFVPEVIEILQVGSSGHVWKAKESPDVRVLGKIGEDLQRQEDFFLSESHVARVESLGNVGSR